MHWIIASIIMPIPLFHMWLHALLAFWRKRPWLFYLTGLVVWIGSFILIYNFERALLLFFSPSQYLIWIGYLLIALGVFLILSSIVTLGPKRFFVWAVVRPDSIERIRVTKGPFRFIPHPAYIGYLIVALGNFLTNGAIYLALLLLWLLALTPIVIVLEEEELRKRVA